MSKNKPKTKKKTRKKIQRYKTGIKGFDKLIKEGIPKGNAVLVEGGPGSGKTNLCLTVAQKFCEQGKKVLYMSFEESEERLQDHMEERGWPADKYIEKDILRIKRYDSLDVSISVEALLSRAKKELMIDVDVVLFPEGFTPDLIVVDSLTSIASAFSGEGSRFRIYMEQFFRYLEEQKISSFLIREVSSPSHTGNTYNEKGEAVSFLSDGIVVIYNVIYKDGKRDRALEVLKMSGSEIDRKIVKMKITKEGVKIYPNQVLKGDFELT